MTSIRRAEIEFCKIEGCGNDFIFIDLRGRTLAEITERTRPELVRELADRHLGVGSDGVVFVESSTDAAAQVRWDFYNPDGSSAEMCGNAARCMGRWAQFYLGQDDLVFQSRRGLIRVRCEDSRVSASVPGLNLTLIQATAEAKHIKVAASLVNTGVPHFVVEVSNLKQADTMKEEIRALRHHPMTGQEGANVTFLERRGTTEFATKTFERGVEGFTQSCGTGVMAAAAVGLSGRLELKAELETPGGKQTVVLSSDRTEITLTGPAAIVFTGQWRRGQI